jgi:pyrroline-5-carboxylate reductase
MHQTTWKNASGWHYNSSLGSKTGNLLSKPGDIMLSQTIAFIGSGTMAEAMIAGLLQKKLASPERLLAAGPRKERGAHLHEKYGVQPFIENSESVTHADVIVLSVKPQRLSSVLKELKGIRLDSLVLSIVAGATILKISKGLDHAKVVRAMPNTPAEIGEGITVWTANKEVSDKQIQIARSMLEALGDEIYVEDENFLDMATALSGTGPSYVFLFMESMIDAGVHMGLPRRIAEQLVLKTLIGSAAYYGKVQTHPAALRNQVTSPGGTSAEALYYLEKAGFRTAISRAIWAAYQRTLELGGEKPAHFPEAKSEEDK